MQRLQLGIADAALDRGHAARPSARGDASIHHGAVVGPMAGGLHNHITGKAQVVAQGKQLRLGGVARRVLALGRIGKLGARAKHVAVGVHRPGQQLEARLGRAGVPVQPAGGLGEVTCGGFAPGGGLALVDVAQAGGGQRFAHLVHVQA